MDKCLKVSVIIPVYNTERYLSECLDSVVNQSLSDIEIICVDDGSTDRSVDILNEYAAKDERIRPICFVENQGTYMARKAGVEAAKGKYILFLDSDDAYHSCDALMRLYSEMERQQVDILQFGVNIIPEPGAPASDIAWLEIILKPYTKRVDASAEEMLRKVFIERKWMFTLWNKIYRSELVKKAQIALPDIRLSNAEDMYLAFAIAYFSRSYKGVEGCSFYDYRFGRGGFGKKALTMEFFQRLCSRHRIIEPLYTFLDKQYVPENCTDILIKMDRDFLYNTVSEWKYGLPKSKQKEGFDLLCSIWPVEHVISAIAKKAWYERREIAEAVRGAACLAYKKKRIKTIAMYYHGLALGGVERVISILASKWMEFGYRIVLITDYEPSEQDYALPEGMKRIVIPDWRRIKADNYGERAAILSRVLKENEVDIVDYNAWNGTLALWDMLLIKSLGIAINYHTHGISSVRLSSGDTRITERYAIASLADSVATLSRVDAELYRCANANVHYISNPLYEKEIEKLPLAPLDEKTVLWVGRISREKHPLEAIKAFIMVNDCVPDAKLLILGDGDETIKEEMDRLIAENHLEEQVIRPGAVSDVQPYYLKAGMLIMTSEFEGHPMVMQEALSYGVPVVTYRMDYLELIRQCPSIISVDQLDAQTMAEQIIRLLQDDEERKRIGAKARQEILEFARNSRVSEKWKELFASIEEGRRDTECDESHKILMDTIMEHMALGSKVKSQEMTQLKKAYADRERILSSRSYKLARLIGKPIRLLRRIMKQR